ncbi:MAG TPA: uridine kinase [Phaeodactylibacter sp.]|nr:uridine kinase [Phaeodactylibacter sp.]
MKPYIIGITGGSGSGKTTFVKKLRASFSKEEVCILSQDDYYFTKEHQKKDKNGIENFDRPSSIDKKSFVRDEKKLIGGETVTREEYMYNNKNATPKILTFVPAPIIIVEGIFVFHYKKIRKNLDLKIFIEAKENLKVIRRITRDQVERNYPLDDVLYRYENHILPAFEKYILPYRDGADIVINNNVSFDAGLEVVLGFLKNKITTEI